MDAASFALRNLLLQLKLDPNWLNEPNLYAFVRNNPDNAIDPLGLWAKGGHHHIIESWLGPEYRKKQIGCCTIDVVKALEDSSDQIDELSSTVRSDKAYQHAMRSAYQTPIEAREKWAEFMRRNADDALILAKNKNWECDRFHLAFLSLGFAVHAYTDSYSPSHGGFQIWFGPEFGPAAPILWAEHEALEIGNGKVDSSGVIPATRNVFQQYVDDILKE